MTVDVLAALASRKGKMLKPVLWDSGWWRRSTEEEKHKEDREVK